MPYIFAICPKCGRNYALKVNETPPLEEIPVKALCQKCKHTEKLATKLETLMNKKPYDDYICIDKKLLKKIIDTLRRSKMV